MSLVSDTVTTRLPVASGSLFFFFFPSQSYQEEENVPFLTECSNISPGVGIPGWHGVLELKVQLAKSLLSLELLLLTMVHMHQ